MVKEDCSPVSVLAYAFIVLLPVLNYVVIAICHEPILALLTQIADVFLEDFWTGLSLFQAMTMITIPLSLPIPLNMTFLGYCFAKKFGSYPGLLMSTLAAPALVTIASVIPFLGTSLMCKNTVHNLLISKMRVFRALDASFDT